MNKKIFKKEYLITFFTTIFIIICIVGASVFDISKQAQLKAESIRDSLKYLPKVTELSTLLETEIKAPDDIGNLLKIATIYEYLHQFNQADIYYKKALEKSKYRYDIAYRYALFSIKIKNYPKALQIAELLSPNVSPKALMYKTTILKKLAEALATDGYHPNAVKVWEVCYKYAKNLKDEDVANEIKQQYSDSQIELADYYIDNNDPQSAILALENSMKITKNNVAKYKLALIYKTLEPKYAIILLEEITKDEPDIVNFDLYAKIIKSQMEEAVKEQNTEQYEYYGLKLRKLTNVIKRNHIYRGDLIFSDVIISKVKKGTFDKEKFAIKFNLKNNTNYKITNLLLKCNIKFSKNYVVTMEKKVAAPKEPLAKNGTIENIIMISNEQVKKDYIDAKNAAIEIYARKTATAPWVLVDFFNIYY